MTPPPITPYQKIFRNSAGSDSRWLASYWPVSCPARLLPSASDRNHMPITGRRKGAGRGWLWKGGPPGARHGSGMGGGWGREEGWFPWAADSLKKKEDRCR